LNYQKIQFNEQGLVPVIVQSSKDNSVLMLAYMNSEALSLTLATKETHFFSRSRSEIWHKGKTSGNVQKVQSVLVDCDGDTLLVVVEESGVACHTGVRSCFNNYEPLDLS
jgi:phosphoribosyl-AMP cyclohydrolase